MIYENISDYLNSRGIKQSFIVSNTNIGKQALSDSLNGRRRITADEYEEICNALEVSLDYFTESKYVLHA